MMSEKQKPDTTASSTAEGATSKPAPTNNISTYEQKLITDVTKGCGGSLEKDPTKKNNNNNKEIDDPPKMTDRPLPSLGVEMLKPPKKPTVFQKKEEGNLSSKDVMNGRRSTFTSRRAPRMALYEESSSGSDDDSDSRMRPGAHHIAGINNAGCGTELTNGAECDVEAPQPSDPSLEVTRLTTETNDTNDSNQVASQQNDDDDDEEVAIEAYLATGESRRRTRRETELVEGTREEIKSSSSPSPTMVVCFCAFTAILLALVLGLTLLVDNKDDDNDAGPIESTAVGGEENVSVETTELPSDTPSFSIAPTIAPTTSFSPTIAPSEVPTSVNFDLAVMDIERFYGNFTCCLDDSTSPQYKAAEWLAEEDPIVQFPINFADSAETTTFRYRYTYAVFYFSTNGEDWDDQCNFLAPIHVCDWNCNVSEAVFEQSVLLGPIPEEDLGLGNVTIARYLGITDGSKNGVLCVKEYPFASQFPDLLYAPYGLRFVFNNLAGTIPTEMIGADFYTYELSFNELGGTFPFDSVWDRVQLFHMGFNSFVGNVPSSLQRFSSLAVLRVENNQLTGTLPTELGSLPSLQAIGLSNNNLSGSIPSELSQLINPVELVLNDNMFTGSIPASLFGTSNYGISLQNNRLNGTIPENLPENGHMVALLLSGNELTGSIPSSIKNLFGLQHLQIDFNELSGTIPPSIGNLNLQSLFLDHNDFTGKPLEDDSWLWMLQDMGSLALSSNRFSGTMSSQISSISDSVVLLLSDNEFSGSIPSSMVDLSGLVALRLDNNSFTGHVEFESSLDFLRRFHMQGNSFAGNLTIQCESTKSLRGTGEFFDYRANCLKVEYPCCTECCDDEGVCTPVF